MAVRNRTMKLRVRFYAHLRDLIGRHDVDVQIAEGATVRDLLNQIYAQHPELRAHDRSTLIGVGLEFVNRNYKLSPGEQISIMPPVQGG
jgi:MoaD family protein